MKIVGYGICGPGEAKRYMRATLDDLKRLCDVVVILLNNAGPEEKRLVQEYGFQYAEDDREWGRLQYRIKQDFLEREVVRYADVGDMVVALDMDETMPRLTRPWLLEAKLDAYHVFVVDLWNDPEHYKPASCFWNVRIFRWNGITEFTKKPVHCGLTPEWSRAYNRYAPFALLHTGLMLKEDRARKVARYEKYDPNQIHLGHQYYAMLKSDKAEPFDEAKVHDTIASEVASYKQTSPRGPSIYMNKKQERFAYFRNKAGVTVDVPEKHYHVTMKQPGMVFVGWADDAAEEIEELFKDDEPVSQQGAELDQASSGTDITEPEIKDGDVAETVVVEDTPLAAGESMPVGLPLSTEVPAQSRSVGVENAARPVKRPASKAAAAKAKGKGTKAK